MKSQFIANFKNIGKKGLDFVKSFTVDTYTSLKNDICQEINIIKDFREFRKSKLSTQNTEKSK